MEMFIFSLLLFVVFMDVTFCGCLKSVSTFNRMYSCAFTVYMSLLATVSASYTRPSVAVAGRGIGFPTGDTAVLSRKIGRISCSISRLFMSDMLVMVYVISIEEFCLPGG